MSKTAKHIIDEEIDGFVKGLSLHDLKVLTESEVLTEDEQVLKSLVKTMSTYDENNQITRENWEWFKDSLVKCSDHKLFQHKCKQVNSKLYSVKFFTKINFLIAESVEDEIKLELKRYFLSLTTDDIEEFIELLFRLPFEFIGLVVRYVANILCPDKKALLTPSTKEADVEVKKNLEKKNLIIQNINKVSKGEANTISIVDVKELLDVKAFYVYNPLNVGTLEFLVRMLGSTTKAKIKDMIGGKDMRHILEQILTLPSYTQHLRKIKLGEEQPFFNEDGSQNSSRDITFDDYVLQYFSPEDYIPKVKDYEKEEQIEEPKGEEQPQPEASPNEVNALQPGSQELMNQ